MRKMVLWVSVLALASFPGCRHGGGTASSEPPMNFGKVDSGGLTRHANFEGIQTDDEGRATTVYAVEYPGTGLTSKATLDLSTKAMNKEVFPGKWVITYDYQDPALRILHLPSGFKIYADADGKPGKLINQYTLRRMVTNVGAVYEDPNGREKTVEPEYFEIVPADDFPGFGGVGGIGGIR